MIRKPTTGGPLAAARRNFLQSRSKSMQPEPLEQRTMFDVALINEIYIDPPGGGDTLHEYIELRGTPGMSLSNHYLVIIESENNPVNSGGAGTIEKIFDLNGKAFGSNGFLTFRKGGNNYSVAPGTTDVSFSGELENSGFTAMLIKTDGSPGSTPQLDFDLDVDNNGLDVPTGRADWTILDSIGIHSEEGEATYGRLYGKINFGPEATSNVEPDAVYVGVGFEIEYLGRWGNSTGQTADDWHVSNLTDAAQSGFTNTGDFRQAADPHGSANVESNQGVAYGTNLTGTLGAPNIGPATEVYINEIFLDPPGSSDNVNEYIELRGAPNMPLDDYYLIFLENENDGFNDGMAGDVEKVIDLSGRTIGSNGFLVMHQAGHPYQIAAGTTVLTYGGELDNSGFTAMLIKNNGGAASVPFVSDASPMDLDQNNDGLDVASGHIAWDIQDSIGIHSEEDEIEFGRLYGKVNFGPGPNGVPIANYHNVGFEIEYVGRWGDSTGSSAADWHVSNVTDNALSGYTGHGDFRQSANPHGSSNVESNQNVPYGTNVTSTLGATNYPDHDVVETVAIIGRYLFYNQSGWDGGSAAIDPASDNAAIAPDKTAYVPGAGVAVQANASSYLRGINGIIVDIDNLANPGAISASDFTFKVGNNNAPNTWASAPAPSAISVVPGGGAFGSDRIYVTFPSASITNRWLEVQVLATANTGLLTPDIHFWGSKVADSFTGAPADRFETTPADSLQVFSFAGSNKSITDSRDYNRDKSILPNDSLMVFANAGSIVRINIPAGGPFAAPAVTDDDGVGSAVASALAARAAPQAVVAVPSEFTQGSDTRPAQAAVSRVFSDLGMADAAKPQSLLIEEPAADELIDSLLEELELV